MAKIAKDDVVIVTTGKDKGKTGTVLKVLVDNDRALVEGINMNKKHVKPNPNKGEKGGIIEKEAPIHISNLAVVDSVTGKPSRIGFRVREDGSKVRYLKKTNENIEK